MKVYELESGDLLNLMVGRAMGWTLINYHTYEPVTDTEEEQDAMYNDGWYWKGRGGDNEAWQWNPSTDYVDAIEVVLSWKYNWNIIGDLGKCSGTDTAVVMGERYRVILSAPGMPMQGVTGDTLPLAISRAELMRAEAMEKLE
jgi:hypothetical protein